MTAIHYAIGTTVTSSEVTNLEASDFQEFCEVALRQGASSKKKDGHYFCAAMRGGRRSKEAAEPLAVLALDFDALRNEAELARLMDEAQAWQSFGYTTASHDAAAGIIRARVLFALDRPASADEYARVARTVTAELAKRTGVNLAADTACMKIEQPVFTLRANAATWQSFDGRPIDVAKASRINGVTGPRGEPVARFPGATESIPAGKRNQTLTAIAGALRRRGLSEAAIEAAVLAENQRCDPPLPEAEVQRIAASVSRYQAGHLLHAEDFAQHNEPEAQEGVFLGPSAAAVGLGALMGVPYQPPDVVAGLYPRDAGALIAPGETGKTTVALFEAIHVVLGRPLYGHEIAQQGPVLVVTAEDDAQTLKGRLNSIAKAMGLTDDERALLARQIFIEDISERPIRLMQNIEGRAERTAFVEELIEHYRGAGLALAHLDPLSLIGPGEELGNDGMSEMMRTLRHLSRQLGCCVRVAHHVSKEVARNGILDQYSGRGASAIADNARFVVQMVRTYERAINLPTGTWHVPSEVSTTDLKDHGVLLLLPHKHSYRAKRIAPIVLVRDGFKFAWCDAVRDDGTASPEDANAQLCRDCEAVLAFIKAREADVPPSRYSRKRLEDARPRLAGKISRARLRDAVSELLAAHRLYELELPKGEQKGQFKNYLSSRPADLLGGGS